MMMKKAVMYGAGNIGRGFIGQLLSLSGYEVVFLDINAAMIEKLNRDRKYPLRFVSVATVTETTVENVRGVNSADAEAAAAEIVSADLLATAVGAGILSHIAPVIAEGLKTRWESGNSTPLNIIICENLMDAHKVLERLLLENLSENLHTMFRERIGLVEASIGRMVPVTTPKMQEGNILRVWAEPYAELPVDRDGFKGEIPVIASLKPFSPFKFYIERKLFMHNMSHAMLAYLGYLNEREYIWQSVRDTETAAIVRGALQESAEALSRRRGVPFSELEIFSDDLMDRFDNPLLGDTILRVGRDPIRKLGSSDRLIGAAFNCVEQGILPEHICAGVASALLFWPEEDRTTQEIKKHLVEQGLEKTLECYCDIRQGNQLIPVIEHYIRKYKAGRGF